MILVRFLRTQATPGVFFVEINKRLPFTAAVYKNNTLRRIESVFQKVSKRKDHSMFPSPSRNQNGTFEKKCRYVVTLFKSKLLVFIYIENLFFIFVFSVVTTRKNAKKANQKGEKEEEEDPNFSPTDSEAETNASQTTSEEEEEEEEVVQETSNTTPVLDNTKSSSKRLVQIYKYFIGISYGKSLHNLKK